MADFCRPGQRSQNCYPVHFDACQINHQVDWTFGWELLKNYIIIIGASLSEPHIYVKYVNSVCLSVRTFITRQFTNVVLIYGVPLTVDCSFEDDVRCANLWSTFNC